MNFIFRHDILSRDLVALECIGPSFGFAGYLFVRVSRHFVFEALRLCGSACRQKAREISATARPEHGFDRGFGRRVAREVETWEAAFEPNCWMATVAVPTARSATTPTTTAVLSFVHAITFNVVSIRVKVEVVTAVPFTAATVAEAASPTGAA